MSLEHWSTHIYTHTQIHNISISGCFGFQWYRMLPIQWKRDGYPTKGKVGAYYQAEQVTKKRQILTHGGRMTHICVSTLTIIGSENGLSRVGAKSSFELMLPYCQSEATKHIPVKLYLKFESSQSGICFRKCRLRNGGPYCLVHIAAVTTLKLWFKGDCCKEKDRKYFILLWRGGFYPTLSKISQ